MFRVINVKRYRAKKHYKYYDGEIFPGTYYYRGFAINEKKVPFEFFFTDDSFWEKEKIPTNILKQEFERYQQIS